MSGLTFQFSVAGEKQVGLRFLDLAVKVNDLSEPFSQIGADYLESEKTTFDAEGAFEGKSKWKPLNEKYVKFKRKKFGWTSILVASGKLHEAVTTKGAEGNIFRIGKLALELGVNLNVNGWNLGLLHQLGTAKMPAREIIRISEPQRKRWIDAIRNFYYKLEQEAEKAFKSSMASEAVK